MRGYDDDEAGMLAALNWRHCLTPFVREMQPKVQLPPKESSKHTF